MAEAERKQDMQARRDSSTIDMALQFIKKMMDRFRNRPNVYLNFLEALDKGKRGIISKSVAVSICLSLLQDHQDLVMEFSKFIPPDIQIDVTLNDRTSTVSYGFAQPQMNSIYEMNPSTLRVNHTFEMNSAFHWNPLNYQVFPEFLRPQLRALYPPFYNVYPVSAATVSTQNQIIVNQNINCLSRPIEDVKHEPTEIATQPFGGQARTDTVKAQLCDCILTPIKRKINDINTEDYNVQSSSAPQIKQICKTKAAQDISKKIDFFLNDTLETNQSKKFQSGENILPIDDVLNNSRKSVTAGPTVSINKTYLKNKYFSLVCQCEDDRFELDLLMERNLEAIRSLENVQKKIALMKAEEINRFKLNDCLGGTSEVCNKLAIDTIYGERSADIIEGLKKCPQSAVPVVLKRLRAKSAEWRESQKNFNNIWREQMEKYYLKSLDFQGLDFKKRDIKTFQSKNLLKEIEILYNERYEKLRKKDDEDVLIGSHMKFVYKNASIINDASDLLFHYMIEQSHLSTEEKQHIEKILKQFLPKFHFKGDDDKMKKRDNNLQLSDDAVNIFFGNNFWYLFIRVHHVLCERMTKIYDEGVKIITQEMKDEANRKDCVETALSLKPKVKLFEQTIAVKDYYSAFLTVTELRLNGEMDSRDYEELLRQMFGSQAYIVFTLDKLVQNAVIHLQRLVRDDSAVRCLKLFFEEKNNADKAYQKRCEQLLIEENCFKFCFYKLGFKMTIELLDTACETILEVQRPRFLSRNVRSWHKKYNERCKQPIEEDDNIKDLNSDATSDLEMINKLEKSQFRFNLNTFNVIYLVNQNCLYKKMAFHRSRQLLAGVNSYKKKKFEKWLEKRLDELKSSQ